MKKCTFELGPRNSITLPGLCPCCGRATRESYFQNEEVADDGRGKNYEKQLRGDQSFCSVCAKLLKTYPDWQSHFYSTVRPICAALLCFACLIWGLIKVYPAIYSSVLRLNIIKASDKNWLLVSLVIAEFVGTLLIYAYLFELQTLADDRTAWKKDSAVRKARKEFVIKHGIHAPPQLSISWYHSKTVSSSWWNNVVKQMQYATSHFYRMESVTFHSTNVVWAEALVSAVSRFDKPPIVSDMPDSGLDQPFTGMIAMRRKVVLAAYLLIVLEVGFGMFVHEGRRRMAQEQQPIRTAIKVSQDPGSITYMFYASPNGWTDVIKIPDKTYDIDVQSAGGQPYLLRVDGKDADPHKPKVQKLSVFQFKAPSDKPVAVKIIFKVNK